MRLRNLLLYIGCLALTTSCNLDDSDKEVIVAVDTNFSVSILEELGTPGALQFEVRTIENRPCKNSIVKLDLDMVGNEINLYINEVEEPTDCQLGEAPAIGKVFSGFLPMGVYNLRIVLTNAIENFGTLEINPEEFIVNMESNDGMSFLKNEVHKVPSNILWGYFAFDEGDRVGEDAQALLEELRTINFVPENLEGYYGYFEIQNETIEWMRLDSEKSKVVPFVFKANKLAETIDLIVSFKNSYSDSQLEASLFLWDGRSF